jgi:hypothetical protein
MDVPGTLRCGFLSKPTIPTEYHLCSTNKNPPSLFRTCCIVLAILNKKVYKTTTTAKLVINIKKRIFACILFFEVMVFLGTKYLIYIYIYVLS